LANLFIIAFLVADIVIRVGHTSSEIGRSEIAYLAAETAIENAIYQIEADRDIGGLVNTASQNMVYTSSSWTRYAFAINNVSLSCVDTAGRLSYFDSLSDPTALTRSCLYTGDAVNGLNTNDISSSNPLRLRLKQGKSFQLELDISGIAYPDNIIVSWLPANSAGKIIVVEDNEQFIVDTAVAPNFQMFPANNQRLRIVNQSVGDVIYTITPSFGSSLPLGILIHARGNYGDEQERTIEVERRNWRIY
jgi:hypothetical protein